MGAFLEALCRILCCMEEDDRDHRQTERNLGHGGPLLERIRSASVSLPTYHHHHHQEQESSLSLALAPPSSSPPRVDLVVHNPLTRDLIGLINEPKLGMTVDELTMGRPSQSSHGTPPFASAKPSHFAPKPFIVSSSDPFVSPAELPLISSPSKQYLALSPQPWSEPSSSRLQCPSSKTSSPTPEAELNSSQSAKQCKPVLSPAIFQTEPTSVDADWNKYVPKSETSHSLLSNTDNPSPLKFTPPSSSSSTCHVVVHNPMTRDPIRPKSEPNLSSAVGGLTQSSQVTSPFKAVSSASPKPSPSVSKLSTATSSDPFVSPAKAAAISTLPAVSETKPPPISAHSNQNVATLPRPSNELSSSCVQSPSSMKTLSPPPKVQKHSAEHYKWVVRPVVSETKLPPISAHSNQNVVKPSRPSNELSSSRVQSPSSLKTTSPTPKVQKHSAEQYKRAVCPVVSETKPPPISAHSNHNGAKPSRPSNELSSSRVQSPSSLKTSSPNPEVQKHSSEQYKWVVRPVVSETKLPPISAHSNQNVAKPSRPSDEPSSSRVQSPSSCQTTLPTPKVQGRSAKQYKPVLRAVSPDSPNQQKETVYVQKDTCPNYNIPEDIEDLIKQDIVPRVLQKPLSPSTYRDYFAALLYAEDFYIEKWTDFIMKDVTLELDRSTIYKKALDDDFFSEKDCVTFVKFKMESIPERRPFLLSRDFVFAKPLSKKDIQFQGFVYKVQKSSIVLAEFGDDFHSQHHPSRRYNISFSFNRVCLKRAHQAVEAATDPSLRNFLFPECTFRRDLFALPSLNFSNDVFYLDQRSAIREILSLKGSPPFLIEGPLCTRHLGSPPFLMEGPLCTRRLGLSRAGVVVREAVLQVYQRYKDPRILVAAPTNKTCDVLMRSLKKKIPDSEIFRANAAFREKDGVPVDILPSCLYREESECFACPPLPELQRFKVIFSTFVSSFRLHNEGINVRHFSHIFLIDASSTSEPEAMIVLANLANKDTTVIVTGAEKNRSGWVRSPIARGNGLRISYFERLKEFTPYKKRDPAFIAQLAAEPGSDT